MADFATESGHWYHKETGEPCHTIIGKNGKERNTNLRDARTLGLVPSVTFITRLASAPGLDMWKQDQTILACLTMPKIENESESDYIKRIKEDARSHAKQRADEGTEIHGYIERGFRGEMPIGETGHPYYQSVWDMLFAECGLQEWKPEKSFASWVGYGGKVDLHNDEYLIDFKTTEKELESLKTWDEQHMQLAAYDAGLGGVIRKCGILYVHTKTAESRLIWIDEKDLLKGFKCFYALLDFYYAKTGLDRQSQ